MPGATIWLVQADRIDEATLVAWQAWLSPGETLRLERFVRAERRRQFIVGRVLLRSALGSLLGVDARSVVLQERPGQGPALVVPAPVQVGMKVGMSIAHSGIWVACAVSAGVQLGLDVEQIDAQRDWRALAQHAFAQPAAVASMEDFYRRWTAQEAAMKLGQGGHCRHVEHAQLAIALCSAQPLDGPLTLHTLE